jgi:hypothetical protein
MRYPASEKLEIIRTVEGQSNRHLICCAFRAARFTDGTIFILMVVWMRWRIIRRAQDQSGTASQTPAAMI